MAERPVHVDLERIRSFSLDAPVGVEAEGVLSESYGRGAYDMFMIFSMVDLAWALPKSQNLSPITAGGLHDALLDVAVESARDILTSDDEQYWVGVRAEFARQSALDTPYTEEVRAYFEQARDELLHPSQPTPPAQE